MSLGSQVVKGSMLLGSGQLISYGCSFVRNMIFARMLSKADFGIAAAIGMGITVFELAGKLSIGQQVVQAKDGDNERFQATAQCCQFIAGCWSALLIFICGGPLARLFKVSDTAWAFSATGLLCLMNGLQHLDVTRRMRTLDFKQKILVDVAPEVILVMLAFPVAWWLSDYRAIVLLLFVKSSLQLILSHLLAERHYSWSFDREIVRKILAFGGPLVLNAFLMFGYQQADQAVVGSVYSVADLAGYSLAFTLTVVPGYMFQSVMISMMLPLLSQVQSDKEKFKFRYRVCVEFVSLGSSVVSGFLILFSEGLMVTVFGQKYAGGGVILAWLATANAFRLIRSAPTLAAMALGDTFNNVFSNAFRVLSFILVLASAFAGKPVVWIAASGCFGEILALWAATLRLQNVHKLSGSIVLGPTALCVGIVACAGSLLAMVVVSLSWFPSLIVSVLFSITSLILAYRINGVFRENLGQLLSVVNAPHSVRQIAECLCGSFEKLKRS